MSRDYFESLALIPNPEANFDELWVVINRANGRFIERMSLRMGGRDCGGNSTIDIADQVFLDSSVTLEFGRSSITSVTIAQGILYTITDPDHGYSNGDTVTLRNVAGYPSLSNRTWIIGNVTTDTFDLISEVTT